METQWYCPPAVGALWTLYELGALRQALRGKYIEASSARLANVKRFPTHTTMKEYMIPAGPPLFALEDWNFDRWDVYLAYFSKPTPNNLITCEASAMFYMFYRVNAPT